MGSLTTFRIYICKVFETGPTVYRPYPKTLELNYKQLLDEVFVISGIIKVEVSVISRSRRLRLITLTETLIIPDITKTSSNNCLKYKPLWKCSKRFISPQTDGMICFYSNIGCSESEVIFKWRNNNNNNKNKKKPLQGANVRTSCISFSLSQNSHRTRQTNAGNKGCAERFSALKDQHWRHVVFSLSRGHFRNVFVKSSEILGFWSFIFLLRFGNKNLYPNLT